MRELPSQLTRVEIIALKAIYEKREAALREYAADMDALSLDPNENYTLDESGVLWAS